MFYFKLQNENVDTVVSHYILTSNTRHRDILALLRSTGQTSLY